MISHKGPGVYRIRCRCTGYIYIGGSTKVRERIATHLKWLRATKHPNIALQYAWNLFGEENFDFELIEVCGRDQVFDREFELQAEYKGPMFSTKRRYKAVFKSKEARAGWSAQARKQHQDGNLGTPEHRIAAAEGGRKNLTEYNQSEKGRNTSRQNMKQLRAKGGGAWTSERHAAHRERMIRYHANKRNLHASSA